MISKTTTAFLMLGILGVLTEGCYNSIGYGDRGRKEREAIKYEDIKDDVAHYYIDCLSTKESAVYYDFPDYTSPINLTVHQMRWFKTAYDECSPFVDLEEKNECWLKNAQLLLRSDSKYLEATLACICKDYDDKASYCKDANRVSKNRPPFNSQRGVVVLSSLEKKSASCMQNKAKDDDKTGNDMNSSMIYITKHVARCSFSGNSTKCRAISESSSEKNNLRDLIDGTMIPESNFRKLFKSCPPEDGDKSEFQCVIDDSVYETKEACDTVRERCIWIKGTCFLKHKTQEPKESPEKTDNAFFNPNAQLQTEIKKEKKEIEDAQERSLGVFPPIACQVPKQYPLSCHPINPNVPYVFDPPVDVPYCLRTPCSTDRRKQSILDKDLRECGCQPGCYFDKELAELRKYGVPVMPGVPVCYCAIQNKIFLDQAKKVVDLLGKWNPYFTQCTLKTFEQEMLEPMPGAELLPLLDAFGIPAKMCGWGTITRRECIYMNCVWREGRGCFYPVDISSFTREKSQNYTFNPHQIVKGRPKCQNFFTGDPYSILQSFHKCMLAGCSVDWTVINGYYLHLWEIGNTMTPSDHWSYQQEVNAGRIGDYNLDQIHWPRDSKAPRSTPEPPSTAFPLPSIPGGANPFGGVPNPFASGSLFAQPSPSPQTLEMCGPIHRSSGGRPCKPKVMFPRLPDYCPYQKPKVPKFDDLKGSVEGCCEKYMCYLPKEMIRHAHSGPSSYYTPWSPYSPCSASCGGGTHYRTRKCIAVHKHKCADPLREQKLCMVDECGRWTPWSQWTPCVNSCGVRTRSRQCVGGINRFCAGDNQESRQCC